MNFYRNKWQKFKNKCRKKIKKLRLSKENKNICPNLLVNKEKKIVQVWIEVCRIQLLSINLDKAK